MSKLKDAHEAHRFETVYPHWKRAPEPKDGDVLWMTMLAGDKGYQTVWVKISRRRAHANELTVWGWAWSTSHRNYAFRTHGRSVKWMRENYDARFYSDDEALKKFLQLNPKEAANTHAKQSDKREHKFDVGDLVMFGGHFTRVSSLQNFDVALEWPGPYYALDNGNTGVGESALRLFIVDLRNCSIGHRNINGRVINGMIQYDTGAWNVGNSCGHDYLYYSGTNPVEESWLGYTDDGRIRELTRLREVDSLPNYVCDRLTQVKDLLSRFPELS